MDVEANPLRTMPLRAPAAAETQLERASPPAGPTNPWPSWARSARAKSSVDFIALFGLVALCVLRCGAWLIARYASVLSNAPRDIKEWVCRLQLTCPSWMGQPAQTFMLIMCCLRVALDRNDS